MQARPFLDLGVRSEDGCGAVATVPLLLFACSLYAAMPAQDRTSSLI